MNKKIVLCASISFYQDVVRIKNRLTKLRFTVVIPALATQMEKAGNYDVNYHFKTFYGRKPVQARSKAIKNHLAKIAAADAILVINNKKHGVEGYIGGNVLMEMGLAFHYDKPIFILNKIDKHSPFTEEIFAMLPIFLDTQLEKIKKLLA